MIFHVLQQFIFTIVIIYVTAVSGTIYDGAFASIFLRVYVGTTMKEYFDYPLENARSITSQINESKPTVLYIHGFTEHLERKSVRTVVEAYLKRRDHNIIGVDYRYIADDTYVEATAHVPRVGDVIATALDEMAKSGFDTEKLHVVAHSMGCQVASYLGKKVSFQIPRITGLDPAGPLYNLGEHSLSSSDARFVDIIHTDVGFYGVAQIVGTVDFFPNNGRRVQPGCPQYSLPFGDDEFCSHHRSWEFYAESLTDESAFLGVQCDSILHFELGRCSNNTQIIMGYATPRTAQGTVYLMTSAQKPFGLKEKGLCSSTDCVKNMLLRKMIS